MARTSSHLGLTLRMRDGETVLTCYDNLRVSGITVLCIVKEIPDALPDVEVLSTSVKTEPVDLKKAIILRHMEIQNGRTHTTLAT